MVDEKVMKMRLQDCWDRQFGSSGGGQREKLGTPKTFPWRPILGYETVEVVPLASQPITNNLQLPCFVPVGMTTLPLKFPNNLTGFERNPAYAATTALSTRYTVDSWRSTIKGYYNQSDTLGKYSDRLKVDAVSTLREIDEKENTLQKETDRRIGERITEIEFWKNEAEQEIISLIKAVEQLQDSRRSLEKAIADTEGPLHIAQECLLQREQREGTNLCTDQVEKALMNEVEVYRNAQKKFIVFINNMKGLSTNCRAAQQQLETDVQGKLEALGIDRNAFQTNNFSSGIVYHEGIEKYREYNSNQATWTAETDKSIKNSQSLRKMIQQSRIDVEKVITSVMEELFKTWDNTNEALYRRIAENIEAKEKLQMTLKKVQDNLFYMEKMMELLSKAIEDRQWPLKVAHTRIDTRARRKHIELSYDKACDTMVQEVMNIKGDLDQLNKKLQEIETQHQQLLKFKGDIEKDLYAKVKAVFIDRDKCLGIRRSFPITSTIKYLNFDVKK